MKTVTSKTEFTANKNFVHFTYEAIEALHVHVIILKIFLRFIFKKSTLKV